jgi:hypothetical protein
MAASTIIALSGNSIPNPEWSTVDVKRAILRASTSRGPSGTPPEDTPYQATPDLMYRGLRIRDRLLAPFETLDAEEAPSEEPPPEFIEVVFPFGPQNLQHQNYGGTYQQIQRPYLKPLNVYSTPQLRTVTFNAVIVHRPSGGMSVGPLNEDGDSVQGVVDTLEQIASSGLPCEFIYGTQALPFLSFLTQFSYTVKYRNKDGEPLRIEASIQLTERVEYKPLTEELPLIERPPKAVGVGSPPPVDPLSPEALAVKYGQDPAEITAMANEVSIQFGIDETKAYETIASIGELGF